MTDVVVKKRCPTCGERKLPEDFGRNRARYDGLNSHCKLCSNKRLAAYAAANPQLARIREARWKAKNPGGTAERQRRRRKKNPAKVLEATRRERQTNPQRVSARKKVYTALKTGLLERPLACESCGGGGKLHAHHDDYSHPLDVNWLCARCHKLHHLGVA